MIVRNLDIADKTHGWYGYLKTKKFAGVGCTVSKICSSVEWENAMTWMASDFGWKGLPIFRFEYHIEKEEDENIVSIAPLTCWMKVAPTILAPSGKSTARFPNEAPPSEKLPSTKNIEWIWKQDNEKT